MKWLHCHFDGVESTDGSKACTGSTKKFPAKNKMSESSGDIQQAIGMLITLKDVGKWTKRIKCVRCQESQKSVKQAWNKKWDGCRQEIRMETPLHQMVHGYNRDLTAKEPQVAYLPWYETTIPVLKGQKSTKTASTVRFRPQWQVVVARNWKMQSWGVLILWKDDAALDLKRRRGNGTKKHAVRWLSWGSKLLCKTQKKGHVPACLSFLVKTECIYMQLALT